MMMPLTYPVTCHTDYVTKGSTFVAIKGFQKDGADFIAQAIEKGATKICIEESVCLSVPVQQLVIQHDVTVIRVENARRELAYLSASALGYPARQLKIIGVTGTKGKTTTCFLIAHMLQTAGFATALMSTVKNSINGVDFPASLTTAQPDYIHQFLRLCVEQRVQYVVMEVAAQALTLHRVAGIVFDSIIFTNLSLEHLEFYASMEEYFAAKCLLFEQRAAHAPAFVNQADAWCAKIRNQYERVRTFGLDSEADISGTVNEKHTTFLHGTLHISGASYSFQCPALLGAFSLYNVLAATSVASYYRVTGEKIINALSTFNGIPGRLERYGMSNGATFVIDYAHNPSSYQSLLPSLRALTDHLILVFGAGGDRDPARRPLMGELAAQYADQIILTNDNVRSEDPKHIVEGILHGIVQEQRHKIICELDRKKAIQQAYALSRKGSLVALLGKGPEQYLIVKEERIPFSEREILLSLQES